MIRLAPLLVCALGLVACSQNGRQQSAREPVTTGRFKNLVDTDTIGCPTVPVLEKAIDGLGKGQALPVGCYELNYDEKGLPVFGPLDVVNPTPAKPCRGLYGSVCWALVEVPGKGNLWTFLEHLQDKHGH